MKKSLLILITFCISVIGYSQSVGDTFIDDFITYEITSLAPNEVETTDYDITGGTVVNIPASVTFNNNAYAVTATGFASFNNNGLTAVTFPNSITNIGQQSFTNNSLTNVTISSGAVNIGSSAFRNNSITEVTISDTVTNIEFAAFRDNPLAIVTSQATNPATVVTGGINDTFYIRSAIDLTIPSGTLAAYAAGGWTGFNSVTEASALAVGDTFIVDYITYEVTSLTPDTVEAIDYDEINGGSVVDIPVSVSYGGTNLNVISIGANAFSAKGLTAVTIPDGIVTIKFAAFFNNQLTTLVVPDSVTIMSNSTFQSNQLTSVTLSNNITILGSLVFGNNQLTNVTIPNGITLIADLAFVNNQLTTIIIPSTVTTIASGAFNSNPLNSVTSEAITPPSIVTANNGNDSFGNRSVIDLTIPSGTAAAYTAAGWTGFNSVTEASVLAVGDTFVDDYITYEVTSLSPNQVKTIDYDMAGGTVVNIPATVTNSSVTCNVISIDNNAFASNALTSVIIPDGVIHIGDQAFENNSLTGINIPSSVTTIDFAAFRNNDLTSVVIPNSVTSLGNYTFRYNNLVSATISENITLIRPYTFDNNNLTSITIPDSVTQIEGHAFSHNSITNVIIPNNVTYLGNFSFAYNQTTTVTLGTSLSNIEHAAFVNSGNSVTLTNVTSLNSIPPTITTTGDSFDTFAPNRGTIHLHIPIGTTAAYVTDAGALWTGFNPVTEDALSVSDFELANTIRIITTTEAIKIVTPNNLDIEGYTLYSMTGNKIMNGTDSKISTASFAKGIYLLKLDFARETVIKKVVVY